MQIEDRQWKRYVYGNENTRCVQCGRYDMIIVN